MERIAAGRCYKWLILAGYAHCAGEAIGGGMGIQQGLNVFDQRGIIQGRPPVL